MRVVALPSRGLLPAVLAVAIAMAMAPLPASAALRLGDGQLDVNGTLQEVYNSDVQGNSAELADTITTFTPELEYLHTTGLLTLDAAAGVAFHVYALNPVYNSNDPYGNFTLKWLQDESKVDFSLTGSYTRNTEPNPYVSNIETSDNTAVNALFSHYVTEKTGYRLHFDYTGDEYVGTSSALNNVYQPRYGVDVFYDYSPKLQTFFRFDYRDTTLSYPIPGQVNLNSHDDQFLLGVKGDLLTKLNGQVAVGYVEREFDAGEPRQSGLLVDTSVGWNFAANGTLTVFVNDDFDTSPADESVRVFSSGVEVSQELSAKLTVGGRLAFNHNVFTDQTGATVRTDDIDSVGINFNYKFTETISGTGFVTYQKDRSNVALSAYDQAVVGVSVTVKI
jgi:hypothetical protein